jgi:predicted regulator of Ras-like GTPase activity (Roadblock/LC7/MglB family)
VYSAIAVPADGRPVITYHDTTNTALMFIRCADAACSGVNTPVTLDNSGYSSGSTSAIAISSADGFPVISYNAQAVDAFSPTLLRVYKCSNADCTAGVSTDVDAPVGIGVGLQSSVAVPGDGLPVISYFEASDKNLRVAKCSTASCAGSATVTLFDVAEDSGGATSIAIGADGLPVVAYTGGTNLAPTIKVLKCAVAACTSGTVTLVDGTANVASPSMRVPADGLPVMSYRDLTNSRLKVVKCGNASCSTSNTFTVIDGGPNVGTYHSLAVSPDGIPVIAYFEEVVDDLKVYKCANAFCRAP